LREKKLPVEKWEKENRGERLKRGERVKEERVGRIEVAMGMASSSSSSVSEWVSVVDDDEWMNEKKQKKIKEWNRII
jgi:hypothetical protein